MNGAELADGVVLSVEPADCSPRDQQLPQPRVTSIPMAPTRQQEQQEQDNEKRVAPEETAGKEEPEDDEELDDFFNSL